MFYADQVDPLRPGAPVSGEPRNCDVSARKPRLLKLILCGWGGYLRTSNASDQFRQIDRYVRARLVRLLAHRGSHPRRKPAGRLLRRADWPHLRFLANHGLYQSLGSIRYLGGVYAA